jgi:hypothetical protein
VSCVSLAAGILTGRATRCQAPQDPRKSHSQSGWPTVAFIRMICRLRFLELYA